VSIKKTPLTISLQGKEMSALSWYSVVFYRYDMLAMLEADPHRTL
jgi:hypothetical protein